MKDYIQKELAGIREQNLWRTASPADESHLNFSTNDYLGYSRDPRVVKAAQEALEKHGAGGRSSRLISGTLDIHRELEEVLAKFKGTEAALLFPTGFMANLGVITTLLGEGDAVIMDKLNHASLWDAVKLSRARPFVYEHASAESLEKVLRRTRNYKKKIVVTDSLFSMDGDLAPLPEILDLVRTHGAWLMIDDAHATGVLGEKGIGALEHFGFLGQAHIVMGTLSKALGSQGGFVCGSRDLIDLIINRARSFIYTTALSPANCAAALQALHLVGREPARRKKLSDLSKKLRTGIKLKGTPTPIVPYQTGTVEESIRISTELKAKNIIAPAIRPPTVPKGECRLRFSLSSEHTPADIDLLLNVLLTL